MLLVAFGALAGARSLNELVVEAWGEVGPGDPAHLGRARLRARCRRRVKRERLPPDRRDRAHRRRATRPPTSSSRGRGARVWEIAAAGKPAILVPYPFATGDHQAKNAQHFVQAGGAIMVRELDLDDVPDLVRSLLDDAAAPRAMGEAMLRAARPGRGRRDRRGADRACARLSGRRLWFVGIGGAGLSALRAARARVGRGGRRLGPRPDAVPRAARRTSRSRSRPSRHVPDGWEAVVSSAYPDVARAAPRASCSRELVGCAGLDRRRRHARQGDDGGDDRVRAARDRARPRVADRRAGAAARLRTPARARAGSSSRATSRTARCSRSAPRSPSSRTSSSTTTREFASRGRARG